MDGASSMVGTTMVMGNVSVNLMTSASMNAVAANGDGKVQKRKRVGKPKVKTGCETCKKRRVKCDEGKPECLRCLKFGMTCDGYRRLAPQHRQSQRAILPKNDECTILSSASPPSTNVAGEPVRIVCIQTSQSQAIKPLRRKSILPSPSPSPSPSPAPSPAPVSTFALSKLSIPGNPFAPRFQNPAESRYFTLFHAQTALHLSGFYSPNLWSHIVLQASEAEPSIRHAVISIGALEMTSMSLRDVRKRLGARMPRSTMEALRDKRRSETEEHHLFALQQYSKAISEMQKLVLRSERDCRTALIASLLIVCFETYHGNYESAAKQIATGIRLIESRHELAPPPPEIDEELLHAFNRLDIQSMGHTDPFTLAEHLVLKDSGDAMLARMPAIFPSALVARNYFNIIVRRAAHFGCALWQSSNQKSDAESLVRPTLAHFEHSENAPPSLFAERRKYLNELELWSKAFRPLFDSAQPGTNDYLASRTLQMHYWPVHLTLALYPSSSELAYDAYLDMFKELVEMAKIQLKSLANTHDPTFSFDMQNVWPLFVVAKKCRDPVVRREAIRLLAEWPRREGIWDSDVAVGISKWVVSIEEEGMVGDFVEESKRASSVGVKLDLERRRAEVWCLVPDEGGGRKQREKIIEWEAQ